MNHDPGAGIAGVAHVARAGPLATDYDSGMATLYVMRHAKSSWDTGDPDHERPLNDRGRRQSLDAAEYLLSRGTPIERVLCSTSTRTRQTWHRLVDGGVTADEVTFHEEIYESTPADVLPLLRALPDDVATALLVGHFPCVTELVVELAVDDDHPAWEPLLAKFVTSGIATLEFDVPWSGLGPQTASLVDFVAPGR